MKSGRVIFVILILSALNASAQFAYVENSDTQFNAGIHNSTYLTGTGGNVNLGLDYYGRAAGYAVPGSDEWFNGSWKYRQPVLVNSSNPASLFNFTVAVTVNTQALISAGRMNADGSDIRFTTAAAVGSSPSLGYYIESGLNTAATKIWVKASELANGANTLYMYYGYVPAPAVSGMAAAFVAGDNFNLADGAAPSTATWVNIESASPLGSSVRDIQSGRLRVHFGSSLGLRHYGLRSVFPYTFASPRRYHADLNARSTGSDSWSSFTLCPTQYGYSYDEQHFLRFSIKHSVSGPAYTIEKSAYGIKTTLVTATPVGAGFHGVDFLISSSTYKVLLDGAEVYSAANDLTFTNPYLYLEASSAVAAYDDFLFDNVFVTAYASPEPAFGSVGQDQGRRYAYGTFLSQAKDTGVTDTRVQNVNWVSVLSTGSTLGVEVRADNTNVALATFTAAAKGADPAVAGRYVQYRLSLDTTDPRYTSTLSSLTLSYVSPPSTPTFAGAQAIDSWTAKWYWMDASAGQFQEDGYRIADTSGAIKGSVAAGATYWIEAGLNPNTAYTRKIYGYNAAGSGGQATVTKYTYPAPPSVACDKPVSTWLSGTLTCSNLAGFGANGVTYYRYVLSSTNTAPAWTGTEPQWLSGTIPFSPGSGEYYLHVKSYNADGDTLPGSAVYGPYLYDNTPPTVTGFSPSSAPWTNIAGFPVQVTVSDTGGSKLSLWRYKWTTSIDRPGSGWLPGGTSVLNASTAAVSLLAQGTGAQWYLHVEPVDQAGNVGYLSAGPYKLDVIPPTGGVVINGGDAYTPGKNVTLSLTYADSGSGVKEVAYRNAPGSFSAPELPQATSSWTLLPGDGPKTVYYSVTDQAGNFISSASDTIQLDSRTSLLGDSLSGRTSGVMGEPAETFSAAAHLSWMPVANSPLSGKTITFVFNGSTQTALTDSLGAASANFNVPSSSGTYAYAISFSSDDVYSASSSTGTITAGQRPSLLITEDVNTSANAPFTAKATLKDNYTGANITGAVIAFVFNGSTQTAVTNGVGVATYTFTAPGATGAYSYSASYDGGQVYSAKTASSGVGVGLRVTSLIVPGVTALARDPFHAQATLMDGILPVAGATIIFNFESSGPQTAVTNAIGVATFTFTAPVSSGTYPYTAAFSENGTYTASSGGANLTVNRRPVNLVGEAGVGYVNATFQARATLTDLGAGVAGKSVVFVFEGSSATVLTDGSGVAAAVFATGPLARDSTCYYSFAGDDGYGFADSTKTVLVNLRPVALAVSDTSAMLSSSFTAIASLKDIAFTAAAISGKTITFSFRGEVIPAITDALGIASVTYQTGLSTGSYQFYASFAQDGTYLAFYDTGTVVLDKRPSVVSAYPKFVFALDSITTVADLKDGVTGAVIGGETLVFNYNGQAKSTTTASSGGTIGRANAVYVGTGVTGAYSYYADFPGNALYSANSSTAAITVSPRSVSLSAFPQTAILGTTTTVNAEFRDGATNVVVPGKNIKLVFQSSTVYSQADTSGIAAAVFSAPASTGAFNWLAEFAGDQAYAPASSTGTITVNRRIFTLTPIATSKYVWDTISLSATAFDAEVPLSGKAFSFYFQGSTQPATTNGSGVATSVAFSSISVPGSYSFTAAFAGDASYSAQSGSATVTVVARPSVVNAGPFSAIANSTVTLSATLLDANDGARLMAGKSVVFTLAGSTFTVSALTNASGVAVAAFPVSSTPGPYAYTATFGGNVNYGGSTNGNTLTVTLRPSVLEMADYTPAAGSTFTVSAVLKDFTSGAVLAVKPVSFLFLGVTKVPDTDSLGSASTTYLTLVSTQSYPISASFPGDSLYSGTTINKIVYPGKRNTTLQTSDILGAVAKDTFTVTARLSDYDLGTYIAGSTVTFTFTGSTSTITAFTDSTGTASATFTAPASTGNYTYTASYAATALYNGNINTSAVLVNRRTLTISPWDLTSVPASSTFTATAVLMDGAVTVSTKTLSFVFVSTKTAVTNDIGVASNTFTSPASTGTFAYQVSFADGDPLYKPATAFGGLVVILKPTVLEVLDVPDAVVGLKFTGTAKLRDVDLGTLVVATKTISIIFGTNTVNAVTAVGVATAAFTAPASTGTYGYTATFSGDGVYGYSQSTGTITVNRRPVLFGLTTNPNQPYAYRANAPQSSFTITGILSDGQVAGLNLEGQSLTFVFQNSTQTAVTNALGVASVTFPSPVSSGTYAYYGYFYGDNSYNPNRPEDSIKSVTVLPRPTNILPRDTITGDLNSDSLTPYYTFWNTSTQARIMDTLGSQGIEGVTASFVLWGSTITGVTNAIGTAQSSAAFPGVTAADVYPAIVRFDGNGTYAPSSMAGSTNRGDPGTAKVLITQSPAFFDIPAIINTYPDSDTLIPGTLTDWWGRPANYAGQFTGDPNAQLIGYPVMYRINSTPCVLPCLTPNPATWSAGSWGIVTSGNIATATVHSPASAGDYPIDYYFATTPSYVQWNQAVTQRVVRVGRRLTYIVPDMEPFTVGAMLPIDITVKLIDLTQSGLGVNGKNIQVTIIDTGTAVTGTGGGTGKAKVTFAGLAVGTYTYTATFADGDPAYNPATSTGTVIISKNVTMLTADDIPNVPAGNSFTARAVLQVQVGTSTVFGAGRTVNFVFTTTGALQIPLSAVTNSVGVATVTYWSPYVPANYNYTADFPEDANNLGSSDLTNNVQVVKRTTLLTAVPAAVYVLDSFVSTAALVDANLGNAPMGSKPVSFILHKTPDLSSATFTDAAGSATVTYASPPSSGTFQYSATYPGDALYMVSSDTKTLTVSRRVTAIDAVDITTPTNNAFTLSATLRDITSTLAVSTTLAGKQVKFVFNNDTGNAVYGITNATGTATASFIAPAQYADYPYSATFEGDNTYAPVVTTPKLVTVRRRITSVSGTDVLAPAGTPFGVQAVLIDVDGGGKQLAGYSLTFVFTGTGPFTSDGITNGVGQATTTFVSPMTIGTYNFTAAFPGDNTYGPSSDLVNTVTVNVASTTLNLPDGSVTVNNTYYATATLMGLASGAGIAGKPVSFTYNGGSLPPSILTDADGFAYKTFIPVSTGTYRLDAAFAGDPAFYSSASSATITVNRRLSDLTVPAAGAEVLGAFIATATLRDLSVVPSTWVAGRSVDFLFEGSAKSAVTNSLGIATVSYTAPLISGVYKTTATFAGDAVYGSTTTTGDVVVSKFLTQLTVDSGSVTALEVFNATATLRANGVPVPNKALQFTYKGQTLPGFAVTDANGQAFVQYAAGASSGPWRMDANFDGSADPTYNTSPVSSNTITVNRRPCLVTPDNISLAVFDAFTATATFKDVVGSTYPVGKVPSIAFSWLGSTFTTSGTDVSGKVYYSTTAPDFSGTYKVEAFYTGDATFAPSLASTATVTVTPRASQLSLADAGTMIGAVFTATATLKSGSTFIADKFVQFTYEGRVFNAKTGSGGSAGIAVATFTVTLATGATQIDAVFNGDATYFASNAATATVTASMRPTTIFPMAASAIVNNVFVATATLKDIDLLTVSTQSVGFVFLGTTYPAVTNGVGVASVAIPASLSTGTFSLKVFFGGDFKYIASSATLTLTVDRRPTSIVPLGNVVTNALDVFYATATLKDMDLSNLGSKPVYYVFSGSTFTRVTSGLGVFVSTYAAPASSGSYSMAAYFDGDATYAPSTAAILVTNLQRPSGIALNDLTALALDVFKATATLTDLNNGGLKVSARNVTFSFSAPWSASTSSLTDALGVSTVSYTATAMAGAYQLSGSFAGDATYASTTTVVPFPVTKRSGWVTGVYVSTRVLDTFTVTGTFKDNISSAPASGRLINFYLQSGSTLTASTDGSGVASVVFTAFASSGTYNLYTSCPGDDTYNPTAVHVTTVTFARRNSFLTLAAPATVIINSSFTAFGTMYDSVNNSTVPAKVISFLFQGATVPVTTNSLGTFSNIYTANTSSGTYALQASFAGDATYAPSVSTRSVDSLRYPTTIAASSITVAMNEVLTATATLRDYTGSTVPARALLFTFQAAPFTSVTSPLGVAYSTYSAAVASGTYTLPVSFAGDALYDSTNTSIPVLVTKRPARITPDAVTVNSLDVFTATATLVDERDPAIKISGEAVTFEFLVGASTFTNTGTTNGSGIATSTFTAPAAGGYQIRTTFVGNLTYYPRVAYGTVTVTARPAKLILNNSEASIDEVFRATATLTDLATSQAISTRTVTFSYAFGASSAALTDTGGKASVAFAAPASSGTSQLDSVFGGDATYAPAASTATLTVSRRPVLLIPPSVTGTIDEVFSATVNVTDALNASPVTGRSIAFVFAGSTFTAPTSGAGVAVSTFMAPNSSGTYYAGINFAGDSRFLPNGTTVQITVNRRPTLLNVSPGSARASMVFTATATIVDSFNPGASVSGRPVAFLFAGSTFTALTNGSGVAVSTFMAPSSSGTAQIDVSFAGDSRYLPSASTAAVTVLRRQALITFEPAVIRALDVLTATATLTDLANPALLAAGRQLTFSFYGANFNSTTDAGGIAVSTFAGKASSGTYLVEANFAGDGVYEPSYSSGAVTVMRRPVSLAVADTSAFPFENFTASGLLKDSVTQAPLNGLGLVFGVGASTAAAVTNASGLAAASYLPPAAVGNYLLSGDFAGDATYAPGAATATVSVQLRPTAVTAYDLAGAIALDTVTIGSMLTDTRFGTPIAGKDLVFTFDGHQSTGTTDLNGIAVGNFMAPISSGTHYYSVAFAEDSVYAASSSTGAVTVLTRATRTLALNTSADAGRPFTLSAQVVDAAKDDTMAGYAVSSVTVEFKFKDSPTAPSSLATAFATTNSLGIATVTFNQDVPPGIYYYTARFYGNYTYSSSSATAMVKMGLLTSLVAFNVETYAAKTFKVNAKLTNTLSETLADKRVYFKFLGASNSGLTGVDGFPGVAASTFSAPAAAGTYLYTAEFLGDSIYSASNATATVTVVRSPSVILAYPADTTASSTFTVSVALKDSLSLDSISGRDVYIAFNGSTATVNTAAITGAASAQFFSGLSSGTFSYYAWFDGDATFAGTLSTGTVTIALNPTSMVAYNVADVTANSTFTATALIKDASNTPIPGLPVNFRFDLASGLGVTNAQGIAFSTFTAPPSSGTYRYTAGFYGNSIYAASNDTGTVVIGPRPTIMLTPVVSAKLGAPLELTARLLDLAWQNAIAGQTVSFLFNGATVTAVTDSFGVSSAVYATPASTGTYAFSASFTGDGLLYTGSASSAPVTIALNLTTIEAKSGIDVKIREPLSVEAVVRDSMGLQLIGMPVVFTFDGFSQGGTTDAVGRATTTFSTLGLVSTGAYNYVADYPGDTLYVASSDSANVVNVLRRDTLLVSLDKQSTPNKAFTAEAKLTDNVNGSALLGGPVAGKTVIFELFNSTFSTSVSAVTNGAGVSTAAFTAPVATGTYQVTARFADTDPIYLGFLSTGTLTVLMADGAGMIKTKIRAEHADTYLGRVFTATATFTAGAAELPIIGKTLLFSFYNGVSTFTMAGATDGMGVATANFTAPGSSATLVYTASFAAGDAEYAAAVGTATVTVNLFPDSLKAEDVSAYIGEKFTARAVLRDELTLLPVAGKTVVFEFSDGISTVTHTVSAVTSSTGAAEALFVTPSVPGNYTYLARFAGDAVYEEALDTGSVLIASLGSSTFLVGYDVFLGTGEVFAASATLTTKGLPVQGKAVTLSFGGISVVSTTNASGLAFASFTAPASSGAYVSSAAFAGDGLFNKATSTSAVEVVLRKLSEAPVFKAEVSSASVSLALAPVTSPDATPEHKVVSYDVYTSPTLKPVIWNKEGSVASTAPALGFTCPVDPDAATFLKVTAKLADGQEGTRSYILEVPSKQEDPGRVPNYYYMSADNDAFVKVPGKVMDKLSGTGQFSVKIEEKRDAVGFLKAYDIKTVGLPSVVSSGITYGDKKGIKLSISYPRQPGAGVSAAASGQMALYWNNGVEWIKLGGELDVMSGEIYTYSRTFGQFAVKAAPLSSTFALSKVAPRIFTPDVVNADPDNLVNHVTFSYENPGCGEVTIRIFDITGALVRRNLDASGVGVCNGMVWNGKDQAGAIVKGGVYIYQVEAGDKVITGTVVVAK